MQEWHTLADIRTQLVTLQRAVSGTTANPSQQQPEVTTCDGLQESNHTVSPQNKKGNECQTCCHTHTALFGQQKPSQIHCAASAPLGKFHQLRIKHSKVFPCFKTTHGSDLIPCECSAWNESITLVTWNLHLGFPSLLVLKFRDKTEIHTNLRPKEKYGITTGCFAPHLGAKREMEGN